MTERQGVVFQGNAACPRDAGLRYVGDAWVITWLSVRLTFQVVRHAPYFT